ncbi:MAG: hypothetical protein QG577_1582 [Thermodesulfobacteriota bacterium]|nr:hypothetical protein [Thermodesulfobacteriota bacterium]
MFQGHRLLALLLRGGDVFRCELGDDVFEQIFHAIPKPRLVTLVDLIAKARSVVETAGDSQQEKSMKKI